MPFQTPQGKVLQELLVKLPGYALPFLGGPGARARENEKAQQGVDTATIEWFAKNPEMVPPIVGAREGTSRANMNTAQGRAINTSVDNQQHDRGVWQDTFPGETVDTKNQNLGMAQALLQLSQWRKMIADDPLYAHILRLLGVPPDEAGAAGPDVGDPPEKGSGAIANWFNNAFETGPTLDKTPISNPVPNMGHQFGVRPDSGPAPQGGQVQSKAEEFLRSIGLLQDNTGQKTLADIRAELMAQGELRQPSNNMMLTPAQRAAMAQGR